MATSQEIALLQIDQISNQEAYWVFSKQQIEFIISDFSPHPSTLGSAFSGEVSFQDKLLPIIHLEKHFALETKVTNIAEKYIILKAPTNTETLLHIAIRAIYPLRIRSLNFSTMVAMHSGLSQNGADILGAFLDDHNTLYIVPNINTIFEKMKKSSNT